MHFTLWVIWKEHHVETASDGSVCSASTVDFADASSDVEISKAVFEKGVWIWEIDSLSIAYVSRLVNEVVYKVAPNWTKWDFNRSWWHRYSHDYGKYV